LVASLLIDESAGVNEVIIGLLHDTREDTDITDEELAPFGEEVSIGTLKLSKIRD
jgi:(p)ppGpp synthase/HD superfamily hydrolase